MSEGLVKRAREALDGVTPGPWRACETTIHGRKYGGCWVEGPEVDDDGLLSGLLIPISGSGGAKSYTTRLVEMQGHDHNDENARFIAASRELVPAMADRIEELEAKLAKAVAQNRFLSGEMDTVLAGRSDEEDRADAAEAKLAKAVEALTEACKILKNCTWSTMYFHGQYIDREDRVESYSRTIAEINGGGDT